MPFIHDITLNLDMEEVLRRSGIKGRSRLREKMTTMLRKLLIEVNDSHLLEPAVVYEFYTVTEARMDRLCLEGNRVLHSPLLSSVLSSAKELALAVCTIGLKLEREVTECFDRNEPLRGVLLDGIGTAAVDSLTREVCRFVRRKASSRDYQVSSLLSPGMDNFPISEQWPLFEMVPADEIGVSLTSSGVMVPRKSASMVIGIGPEMPSWTRADVCARCALRKTCRFA